MLVTGASGGIGRAVCLAFAQAGWDIGVHFWRHRDAAKDTLAGVQAMNANGQLLQADIRRPLEVQAMVQSFVETCGRLDVLVCGAGVATSHLLVQQSLDDWRQVLETNLTGTFHCLRAAAPVMVEQRSGSVIIVGSYAGSQGSAGQSAYATSKAGLLGLARTAAKELGSENIRVNVVLPGWKDTGLTAHRRSHAGERHDHVLGRYSALEEVAEAVCRLAQLQDVSGQVWNLDSRLL